ncbi:baseplate J/gp47 family protein [Candidatus Gottesmanbacteria bacterium]|nr:baseplate J/gp47 family protein [Candidatus Gottesmanbacteria bacterium]
MKRSDLKETLSRFISGIKLPDVQAVAVPKFSVFVVLIILILLGGGCWLSYWVLPRVSVTILELPKTVSASSAVTVNPTATVVDAATKTVPGRKQEKTVSGDKTTAVTGQKDIGDPARGTVTVYNKTLLSKQLKKGTVLTAGSLSFILDSDVTIASASESLASGSVTYGKASTAITATTLGPQSNLPASTEFSVKDTPSSVMVARNDATLSGGTSKVVTVVSRADFDALVADLTKDLIVKAKAELGGSVAGGGRLIDETVKTTVTQKKFDAELDQEAKELHGTITVTISGISYSDEDIASLFGDLVAANVPPGYTLRKSGERVNATNVKLQKDGSIGLSVVYEGQALPTFDLPTIRSKLAGKSYTQVQEELKAIAGVGGIEMGKVSWSLWGPKLPANAGNIAISVAVLE